MQDFIVGNGALITLGEKNRMIPRGAVYVQENVIADVGGTEELLAKHKPKRFIDASGKLIMPGLTNTHMHLYSTFARGMSLKDEPPANFIQILERLWWRLDKALTPEDVYYSALIPLLDCVRKGATTIVDHHASPYCCRGSLEQIERAVREVGVRSCLCYEVSDRDGEEIAGAGIKENIEFIKKWRTYNDSLLAAMFGLHASFTISDKTLNKAVEEGKSLGVGFHIHVAEDRADVDDSMKKYGMRVVERLYSRGVLGNKTIAAHCVHINEREMDLLAESETNVVHNAQSNMGNAVGCAPVLEMLSRGITVGMGTDGYTCDMFEALKVASILHKLVGCDPRVGWAEIPTLSFTNNIRILGKIFPRPLGEISIGAFADIILVDYVPPTPLLEGNFFGHLLFGISSGQVDTTIIDGKVIMENKRLVGIDEERICARSRELAQKLWERF